MTEQGKAPAAGTGAHTPGPWRAKQAFIWGPGSTNERVNWIPDPHRFAVYGPRSDEPAIADDVWEPNAKLIAAAPALADALEAMLDRFSDYEESNRAWVMNMARDALRAAGLLGERSEPAEGRPSPEIPAIPDSKG